MSVYKNGQNIKRGSNYILIITNQESLPSEHDFAKSVSASHLYFLSRLENSKWKDNLLNEESLTGLPSPKAIIHGEKLKDQKEN